MKKKIKSISHFFSIHQHSRPGTAQVFFYVYFENEYLQKFLDILRVCKSFLKRTALAMGFHTSKSADISQIRTTNPHKPAQRFNVMNSEHEILKEQKKPGDYSTTKLPIIFIHKGYPDYFNYSLKQALLSNPESTIYLLGDSSNNCLDFVEHYFISEYFQGAEQFSKVFNNYNSNPFGFELFCFQRWFILKDFLLKNNLMKCLYIDSDTMLYADITEEQKKFEYFDFTLSHGISGNTCFVNNIEALSDFCQFAIDIYTKKDQYHYDKMVGHYVERRKNNMAGGASDMRAFQHYAFKHWGTIGYVDQVINDSVFDPRIDIPAPGFEMSNGIKKLIWKNGIPYGKHLKMKKEIKFNSLHCQGRAKDLMKDLYMGQDR